jgi:hypothetical protein
MFIGTRRRKTLRKGQNVSGHIQPINMDPGSSPGVTGEEGDIGPGLWPGVTGDEEETDPGVTGCRLAALKAIPSYGRFSRYQSTASSKTKI